MKRAVLRDAAQSQQFYFRKSFTPEDEEEVDSSKPKSHDHEYTLMDTNTIINGKVKIPPTHTTPPGIVMCYAIFYSFFAG